MRATPCYLAAAKRSTTYLSTSAAVIIGALTIGCGKPNEFVAPPPPSVTVAAPQQLDTMFFIDFPGRTVASDEVDIRARVKGFLREVKFKDGNSVEKGDELCLIEPETYQAAVSTAQAQVQQADAGLGLADTTLKRLQKAFETQAVSELDVLDAEAKKAVAEAQLSAAKAQLVQAELDLTYTRVIAPISGRITESLVSEGNLVGGGEATLLARIVVLDPINIYFNVDERMALRIGDEKKVETVNIQLADGSETEKQATIDYVDPDFDPSTGTILVRSVMPNADATLRPGLFARVRVPRERTGAVVVPEFAIQRDLTGPYLLTVDEKGLVSAAPVKLGPAVKEGRIIDEGISPADSVVISGLQRARAGITVTAVPSADTANR